MTQAEFKALLAHLVRYQTEHGDMLVPQRYVVDGFPLGRRVNRIRTGWADLPAERREALEAIGFVVDAQAASRNKKLTLLELWGRDHATPPPAGTYLQGVDLAQFWRDERARYDSRTPEDRARLEALPFWGVHFKPGERARSPEVRAAMAGAARRRLEAQRAPVGTGEPLSVWERHGPPWPSWPRLARNTPASPPDPRLRLLVRWDYGLGGEDADDAGLVVLEPWHDFAALEETITASISSGPVDHMRQFAIPEDPGAGRWRGLGTHSGELRDAWHRDMLIVPLAAADSYVEHAIFADRPTIASDTKVAAVAGLGRWWWFHYDFTSDHHFACRVVAVDAAPTDGSRRPAVLAAPAQLLLW